MSSSLAWAALKKGKAKATQSGVGEAQPAPETTTTPLPELIQPPDETTTTPSDTGGGTPDDSSSGGDQTTTTEQQGQEPVAGTSARKRRHRRMTPAGIRSLQPQSSAFDRQSTEALLTFLLGTP